MALGILGSDDPMHDEPSATLLDGPMRERLRRTRVVFSTDIPTPYVLAVVAELARRVALTCLFSSESGTRGMGWKLDAVTFRHRIVGGVVLRRLDQHGIDAYVSPRLLFYLFKERPEAIICAGYSYPTIYALAYSRLLRVPLLIY